MRLFYCFLLAILLLVSCRKGKKLSTPVSIQLVCPDRASVYPKSHFPPFDAFDPFESIHYPQYAHNRSPQQIAGEFRENLIRYLKDNNLILKEDSAEYKLVIRSMTMSESLERTAYTDICTNRQDYVYHASLKFRADVSLFKQQNLLKSWDKQANSFERIKSETDDCNRPKTGILFRGPSSLIDQVTRELRPLIAKKMYEEN